MNWQERIEAQIRRAQNVITDSPQKNAALTEVLDSTKALLDVAVAADKWRRSDDPGHSSACSEDAFCEVSYAYCESCKLRDALDKLKETAKGG